MYKIFLWKIGMKYEIFVKVENGTSYVRIRTRFGMIDTTFDLIYNKLVIFIKKLLRIIKMFETNCNKFSLIEMFLLQLVPNFNNEC